MHSSTLVWSAAPPAPTRTPLTPHGGCILSVLRRRSSWGGTRTRRSGYLFRRVSRWIFVDRQKQIHNRQLKCQVEDLKWISVWCKQYNVDFGHFYFNSAQASFFSHTLLAIGITVSALVVCQNRRRGQQSRSVCIDYYGFICLMLHDICFSIDVSVLRCYKNECQKVRCDDLEPGHLPSPMGFLLRKIQFSKMSFGSN